MYLNTMCVTYEFEPLRVVYEFEQMVNLISALCDIKMMWVW